MADNVTRYIIQSVYDGTGTTSAIRAQKLVQQAVRASGGTFNEQTKVLSANVTEFKKAGQPMLRLNSVIRQGKGPIEQYGAAFEKAGNKFRVVDGSVRRTTRSIDTFSESSKSLGANLGRLAGRALLTIPVWLVLRAAMTGLLNGIRDSIKFFIDFEAQLAQVQIVGNATAEEINKLGRGVLRTGIRFGASFESMGEAMKLWAQQGKSVNEILALMGPTMQLSLLSGRSLSAVVEDLTAITKSYRLEAEEATGAVDKITAVMLTHAITADNLSAGLRRLAPVTAQFNISLAESIGFITAVQTQTRRGGQTVGDALRTIFTRMQRGSEQAIQSIAKVPVFLDDTGNATFKLTSAQRSLQDILGDIATRWDTLNEKQKSNLGVTLAGRRRVTEFLALMNNWQEQLDATADAFFSSGSAMEKTSIITETLENRTKQLANSWKLLLETVKDPALDTAKGGVSLLTKSINLLRFALNPSRFRADETAGEFRKIAEAAQTEVGSITNVVEALKFLQAQSIRINAALSRENSKDSPQQAVLEKLQIERRNFERQFGEQLQKETGLDFTGDLDDIVRKGTENFDELFTRLVQSEGKVKFNNLKAEIEGLKQEAKELSQPLESIRQRGGARAGFAPEFVTPALEKRALAREKEKLAAEKALEVTKLEQGILDKSSDIFKQRFSDLQKEFRLRGEALIRQKEAAEILADVSDKEQGLLATGQSRLAVRKATLAELEKQLTLQGLLDPETGAILDPAAETQVKRLRRQIQLTENQKALNVERGKEKVILIEMSALGASDLQIQNKKLEFAQLRSLILKDDTEVLREQLALDQLIAKQVEQTSVTLKESFSGGLKDLLQGTGDVSDLFDSLTQTIDNEITGAISKGFTDRLFQETGLGEIFGTFTSELEKSFNNIKDAHTTGIQQMLDPIRQAHVSGIQAGLSGSALAPQSNLPTGGDESNQGSLANLFKFQNPGVGGALGAFATGALGGLSRGNGRQAIIGGLTAAASAINPLLGIGVGILGSLFGNKKKDRVEVQERERTIQVASRIDVTNKKLDFVNRNLIALKASFDTFVLPDSAFFATKRNLEDQFSINARRGVA